MIIPSEQLFSLMAPQGGFLSSYGGSVRPDSTAWACIILSYSDQTVGVLEKSLDILATFQLKDGRVSLSSQHPETLWPTPLAILAWQKSSAHRDHYGRAIRFLLESSGKHWKRNPTSALAHDPALKGWAWIDNTHSWVETTALAIIALHNAGYETHPRLHEATAMLLDRQLPKGGWNYGNTKVFGTELRPSPEDTGAALSALIGRTSRSNIAHSLDYLIDECSRLRTPIALGWSLLGLNAWGLSPSRSQEWIEETLSRNQRYSYRRGYDTSSLCLLFAPLIAPRGLKVTGEVTSVFSAQPDYSRIQRHE